MSNKKFFWGVFLILSCCEFAQVAYSKNISQSAHKAKQSSPELCCYEAKAVSHDLELNPILSSYLLPR